MDFKDLVQKRRSIRRFTEELLTEKEIQTILRAGLMAPTGHNTRSWNFTVVEGKDKLAKLALAKENGAEFVADAAMAVVVSYNTSVSQTWIEDASIAAITMQYQATDLGLGSCWAQIRNRKTVEGVPTQQYLREMLSLPDDSEALCIIGFGHPAQERKLQDEDKLVWNCVVRCK